MINLSGFNGTTVGKPVEQKEIMVHWASGTPKRVWELGMAGETIQVCTHELRIPSVNLYRAYLVEFEQECKLNA